MSGNTNQPQKTDSDFIMEVVQLKFPLCGSLRCHEIFSFCPQEQSKKKRLSGLDAHKAMMRSFWDVFLPPFFCQVCQANILAAKAVSDSVWHLDGIFLSVRVSFTSNESL